MGDTKMRLTAKHAAMLAAAAGALTLTACGGMGNGSEEMYDEFLN